jgi:hypothetical protein
MRIGIVAARLGDVDGVSFETLKWQTVLESLGHTVLRCAGTLGESVEDGDHVIPEMRFDHPASSWVTTAAFEPGSDPDATRAEIDRLAAHLDPKIRGWVESRGIELLIVQNAWAIPMQLPLAVALARLVRDTGLPAVGHHHDYWWERERFQACVVPRYSTRHSRRTCRTSST